MATASEHAVLSGTDHKTLARVESFGDIVFGFSLFNLAINLRVPQNPHELVSQIPQFLVFVGMFALLCALWWMHHRLFREYFKPDGAGISLNFAFLASVVLFTYPLQLYVKFGPEDPITVAGYASGNLLVFGFLAAMFIKGVYQFRSVLTHDQRVVAIGIAARTSVVTVAMFVAICLYRLGTDVMLYTIGAGAMFVPILRIIEKRAMGRAKRLS